ncbi:MAG: hypothetical protein Q8O87_03145 [bacterium]|nr:hypothetical protein [bacterium]
MLRKKLNFSIAIIVLIGAAIFSGLLILGKNYNPHSAENEKPPVLGADGLNIPNLTNDENNITSQLTQTISQQIAVQNPQPQNGLDVPRAEEIVNKYLAEGIASFDYESLKPAVPESDLKIINNSGRQLTESYLTNLNSIIQDNFQGVVINLDDIYSSDWDILQLTYDRTLADLYDLPVPKDIAPLHQQEIRLVAAQQKIFEYIQNYEKDPLLAWLAIEANQQLSQEFKDLGLVINQLLQ